MKFNTKQEFIDWAEKVMELLDVERIHMNINTRIETELLIESNIGWLTFVDKNSPFQEEITVTRQWKPKVGEEYYVPVIDYIKLYGRDEWSDDSKDVHVFNNNLAFRTKEEAISASEKLLELWRKENENR